MTLKQEHVACLTAATAIATGLYAGGNLMLGCVVMPSLKESNSATAPACQATLRKTRCLQGTLLGASLVLATATATILHRRGERPVPLWVAAGTLGALVPFSLVATCPYSKAILGEKGTTAGVAAADCTPDEAVSKWLCRHNVRSAASLVAFFAAAKATLEV